MGFESSSGDTSCDEGILRLINGHPSIDVNTTKKFVCKVKGCYKSFYRPSKLERHKLRHAGVRRYVCKYKDCDKRYTTSSHLKRHVQTSHEKTLYTVTLRCPEEKCKQRLSSQENLKKHYSRHHVAEKYKCTLCSEVFRKKNALAQHLYVHNGVASYNCASCSISFATRRLYNVHMRNHKTYFCFCGESFERWSKYLLHKRISHPNFAEYECDDCKKKFKSKVTLKMHMKVHSELRTVFQCSYPNCVKFYVSKFNLDHHVKSAHEKRTYDCTFEGCDRKLTTKQKLEQHLQLHSSTRIPRKPRKKNTKKRKDAERPKKAMAFSLAGIENDQCLSNRILAGEHVDDLIVDFDKTSESELDVESKNTTPKTVLKKDSDNRRIVNKVVNSKESDSADLKMEDDNSTASNITQLANDEKYKIPNTVYNIYFQTALKKLKINFDKSYVDSEKCAISLCLDNALLDETPRSLQHLSNNIVKKQILQMHNNFAPKQILNMLLNNIRLINVQV